MWRFNLDWSIDSAEDRVNAIKSIPGDIINSLNSKERSAVEKYILCGKDPDGYSPVQKKQIYIDTKFSTYNKNKTVSLDEMMENPAFNEGLIQSHKVKYKIPKPHIDREDQEVQNIEGMKELWDNIDKISSKLKDPDSELSDKEQYYYTHYLKELRDQQYSLVDSVRPTITIAKNREEYILEDYKTQLNYPILPLGIMGSKTDIGFMEPLKDKSSDKHIYTDEEVENFIKVGKPFIDFRNKEHLYQLILYYEEIEDLAKNTIQSPLRGLLWTLDYYIERTELNEQQQLILRDKKRKTPNKEITQHLMEELGIYHQENYVSTIWNKTINQIAETVELHYDEYLCRGYKNAWKVCNRCGRTLLKDPRNFVKKAKSMDGLTGRCKKCDKELRQMNK